MYTYNNIVCLNNSDNSNVDSNKYKDFCYNNISNFSFDKTYIENKTLFIIKDNIIISIFKLDVLVNIFCVSCLYVNRDYYPSVEEVNTSYTDISNFILHTIKLTSSERNITVDMCNIITFKLYLYCNVDISNSLYTHKGRNDTSKTIINTNIANPASEFYIDLKLNNDYTIKRETTNTFQPPQTTNTFQPPQTTNSFQPPQTTNTFKRTAADAFQSTESTNNPFKLPNTSAFQTPNNNAFQTPNTSAFQTPTTNAFQTPTTNTNTNGFQTPATNSTFTGFTQGGAFQSTQPVSSTGYKFGFANNTSNNNKNDEKKEGNNSIWGNSAWGGNNNWGTGWKK